MNRNFLCNLFVLTLFSCWYIDARSLTYDDLKEEIKGLRSIIDRLKEKTDKEDIRINKLTDIVSQDNTVNGDHVRLSRNKRGMYFILFSSLCMKSLYYTGGLKPVLRVPNLALSFYHGSKHTVVRSA